MATQYTTITDHEAHPPKFPTGENDDTSLGIGIALGSPGLAQVPSQDPSMVPRTMTTITSVSRQEPEQPKTTGLSRQISKRIPFLGRSKSKSRRANSNSQPRALADPSTTNYVITPTPPAIPLTSANAPLLNKAPSRLESHKLRKPKPAPMRSVTDPEMQTSQPASAWSTDKNGLLLDVEIPDIRLERYSVMFGGLLAKEKSAGGLLARRQATVARLKEIENELRREHYSELQRFRRVTTPSATPMEVPIAELPGESSTGITAMPIRLRSNTFPMILREAQILPTGEPQSSELGGLETEMESPGTSMLSPATSLASPRRESEERPLLHSKFHKPSVESMRSPYYRQAGERENATALSPPPGNNRRFQDHGDGSPPASTAVSVTPKYVDIPSRSTSLRNLPAAPKPNPKPTSKEEALEDAAEVSIARQISISRGQRRFLEPLHERERRRARANKHIKAASQISMDDGKRIAETKTATPTFIHPGRQPESPQNPYRRSERVTIEGV